MHIKQVIHTFKRAEPQTIPLSTKTILIGPPRSGKTAAINAIEAAVSGRVSDLFGGEFTDVGKLAALVGSDSLAVEAVLDTGEVLTWGTEVVDGKLREPVHAVPEWLNTAATLPLRAVREALSGSPDKAKTFFLGHFDASVTHKQVVDGMAPGVAAEYQDAVDALFKRGVKPSPVACLVAVRDHAAAQKRTAGAGSRAAGKSADASGAREITDEDVQRAEQGVVGARAALDGYYKSQAAPVAHQVSDGQNWTADQAHVVVVALESLAGALRSRAECQAAVDLCRQRADVARADLGDDTGTPRGLLVVEDALQLSIDMDDGDGLCMSCGSAVGRESLDDRLFGVREALMRHKADMDRRAQLVGELRTLESEQVGQERSQQDFDVNIARQGATLLHHGVQVTDDPADIEAVLPDWCEFERGLRVDEEQAVARQALAVGDPAVEQRLQSALSTAIDHLSGIRAAKGAWDAAKADRAAREKADADQAMWKRLEAACKDRISELVKGSMKSLEDACMPYLYGDERLVVVTTLFGRQVFLPGLATVGPDGRYQETRLALSGTEQRRVHLALARAITPAAGPLVVLIPEDRGTDAETVSAEMRLWHKMPQQVVLSSTVKPAGNWPAGWDGVCLGQVCKKCSGGCGARKLWGGEGA